MPESTLIGGCGVSIRFLRELLIAEAAVTGHRKATGDRLRAAELERSALLEALVTDRIADAAATRPSGSRSPASGGPHTVSRRTR